jgi:RNA polymerase sigma factor (sigma-70 family)
VENYKQAVEFKEEGSLQNEQLEQLYILIDRLNPLEKAIMILYLEGRNHKEMAEIMGTSTTNISTRINRIKNKLSSNYQTRNN